MADYVPDYTVQWSQVENSTPYLTTLCSYFCFCMAVGQLWYKSSRLTQQNTCTSLHVFRWFNFNVWECKSPKNTHFVNQNMCFESLLSSHDLSYLSRDLFGESWPPMLLSTLISLVIEVDLNSLASLKGKRLGLQLWLVFQDKIIGSLATPTGVITQDQTYNMDTVVMLHLSLNCRTVLDHR